MILQLAGPIAVGKTTFVKWFQARNPSWKHIDIALMRLSAYQNLKRHKWINITTKLVEQNAWTQLYCQVSFSVQNKQNCIIESTGTIAQLATIWNQHNIRNGVYTVKLWAPPEICIQRAKQRKTTHIPGYDIDEELGILYEAEQDASANLIIDVSDIHNIQEKYKQIEEYVYNANSLFQNLNTAKILGNNKLGE